jgi:hypothetical protein
LNYKFYLDVLLGDGSFLNYIFTVLAGAKKLLT